MESPSDTPTKKVAFLSMVSPGDTPRLETLLAYSLMARHMDYETKIFFALDSGLVLKRPIHEKLDAKLKARLQECVEAGVQLEVCSESSRKFNIPPEDLIPGVVIRGIVSFFVFAEQADINFSWS